MLFVKTQDSSGNEHYINLAQVTQLKVLRGGKWKCLLEVHLSDSSRKTLTGDGAEALLNNLKASGLVVEQGECTVAVL